MGSRQRDAITELLENLARSQREFSATLLAEYRRYNTALLTLYRNAIKNVNNGIQTYIREIAQGQPQLPALQRLQSDVIAALSVLEAPMLEFSQQLETSGIQNGIDLAERNLENGGVDNPTLDRALIAASVFITALPAFRGAINRYSNYYGTAIVQQIANGDDPLSIMAYLRNTTRAPLPSALSTLTQTTQTAQLWGARLATHESYRRNGIQYWLWSAALDLRTCLSCWDMHGSIHPVTEVLNDHYKGRCAPVPVTETVESIFGGDLRFETPRELDSETYFNSLPEDQQRQIMGRGRYEAYKAGLFNFHDMSKQVSNDVYGTMRVPRTLAELTGSITQ